MYRSMMLKSVNNVTHEHEIHIYVIIYNISRNILYHSSKVIPCRKSRSAHFWDSVGMFCRSGDPCDPCDLCAWPTGSHLSANLVMWWDIPRWQMLRNAKCQMQFSQIDSFSGWMMGHAATILIVNRYDTVCIYVCQQPLLPGTWKLMTRSSCCLAKPFPQLSSSV